MNNRHLSRIAVAMIACLVPALAGAAPIRIGAVLPLTGNSGAQGQSMRDGLQLAIDEINGRGGMNGNRLELVVEDSRADVEVGVAAFNRIESQRRPLFYVGFVSSVMMALAPLAEERQVPLVGLSTTAADLTRSREWVFRYWSLAQESVQPLIRIIQDVKPRTLGILYQNDESGRGHEKSMSTAFVSSGGKVQSIMVELTDTDFKSKIASLKNLDAIFVAATGKVLFGILKQIWEAKYGGSVLSTASAAGQPALLSQPEMQGIYVGVPMIYNANYLYAKEAATKFQARFNKAFDQYSANGYDLIILVAGLLEDRELSRVSVRKLLEGGFQYSGVFGSLNIKPGQHELSIPLFPAQVVNGVLKYR